MPIRKVINRKIIFEHPNEQIHIDTIQSGKTSCAYFYFRGPVDAVATTGVDIHGEIALTRQYTHPNRLSNLRSSCWH